VNINTRIIHMTAERRTIMFTGRVQQCKHPWVRGNSNVLHRRRKSGMVTGALLTAAPCMDFAAVGHHQAMIGATGMKRAAWRHRVRDRVIDSCLGGDGQGGGRLTGHALAGDTILAGKVEGMSIHTDINRRHTLTSLIPCITHGGRKSRTGCADDNAVSTHITVHLPRDHIIL